MCRSSHQSGDDGRARRWLGNAGDVCARRWHAAEQITGSCHDRKQLEERKCWCSQVRQRMNDGDERELETKHELDEDDNWCSEFGLQPGRTYTSSSSSNSVTATATSWWPSKLMVIEDRSRRQGWSVNSEGGGRHGLHTDGGGAQADGQRWEEAAYVQSSEAELLAEAMRSETAMLGLNRLAAAEAACQGPRVDGQNSNRWKRCI
jgi:hypothetical protein